MVDRLRFLGLACAVALCFCGSAGAQTESNDANAIAAEALFSQGIALLDAGFVEDACNKFQASQKLDPGVGTLLHLADCYEKAGRFASAWRAFDDATQLAAEREDSERQQVAEVRAAALSARAPKLRLAAPQSKLPDGYRLKLDGVPIELDEWSSEHMLDAGPHTIEGSAPGYESRSDEVLLVNDAEAILLRLPTLKRKAVAAEAVPVSQPAATREPAPSSSAGRTWGYLIATAGALSLGTGGVLAILAVNEKGKTDDDCTGNVCQNPDAVSRRADAKRLADLATIFTVAGAITSVGGLGLIIASPSGGVPSAEAGVSLSVRGSF